MLFDIAGTKRENVRRIGGCRLQSVQPLDHPKGIASAIDYQHTDGVGGFTSFAESENDQPLLYIFL